MSEPRKYIIETFNGETMEVERLLLNRIRTPDGTILTSRFRHDYVTHEDANGETYMTDGGTAYLRRSVNAVPAEDLSVYVTDDHESNREYLEWGTYGKDGGSKLMWKKLKDLDTDHIHAILETQHQLPEWRRELFQDELNYRNGDGNVSE
jgi:hypothetical protein